MEQLARVLLQLAAHRQDLARRVESASTEFYFYGGFGEKREEKGECVGAIHIYIYTLQSTAICEYHFIFMINKSLLFMKNSFEVYIAEITHFIESTGQSYTCEYKRKNEFIVIISKEVVFQDKN